MNKNAIQGYAIWARTELISQVSQRAYQYDITADGYGNPDADAVKGRPLTIDEKSQRQQLINQIKIKGYTQVMEEVAYTWFNRFIALRFMEINNYLPNHIRVFSDASGAFKPEILNNAIHLDMPGLDMGKVADFIERNQTEDLYRYLLLTQCNELYRSLPRMFESMGSYTELLLPNNILRQDGILGRLVTDIPEEDWTDQVQIIGWLYQYYNTELKDDTFALLKKNVKITRERIPSATQLFTPDWVVRYMVENSVGRLWIEGHPDNELRAGWKYFLDEAEQDADTQLQLKEIRAEYCNLRPQDIKVFDPCMGSGHILVYAFDVLMQIYKKAGFSERDAAQSILTNNIYGLDIDERAAQLAYFAVMMKARQYDRRILTRDIQPQIYGPGQDPEVQEYGSMLLVDKAPEEMRDGQLSLMDESNAYKRLLTRKYEVVVTNPPYMAVSNATANMQNYVKDNFPDSKSDMFAVFIERCRMLCKKNGFQAMITQHAWMFLSSFEKLRAKLQTVDTVNMIHLGARAFEEIGGEVVQTTSFVLRQSKVCNYQGIYCRLIEPTTQQGKENMFLAADNRYTAKQSDFSKIPGSPVAYWVGNNIFNSFINGTSLEKIAFPRQGMATTDNNRFLRQWFEVSVERIGFGLHSEEDTISDKYKWFPYNKGGEYRKWYGNNDYVVNFQNKGEEVCQYIDSHSAVNHKGRVINRDKYFRPSVTWSKISSGNIAFRYKPEGFIFDVAGTSIFGEDKTLSTLMGYLNSKVALFTLACLSPTLNYEVGHICSIPILPTVLSATDVYDVVECNKRLSKTDWDSFETSWDFQRHPLVLWSRQLYDVSSIGAMMAHYYGEYPKVSCPLELCFMLWQGECEERFQTLKSNEEELNRIFIDIYGLQDELTPEVEDRDVTVRRANLGRDIRSLISYAVGCMFGRYSLDIPGLANAGGEWDDTKYKSFLPDKDNIIPICDDEYFDDDITGRFIKWVEVVFGEEPLEENLKYIADALGGKGTPREVIRNYFLNDFYADHLKTYQKRPIYWLFDSGKKNGFKALIYMHRYQSDLLARMRTDYVHEQQERYRTQLKHIGDAMDSASASERVKLTKQQKKLQEQALELQKYEEKVHHLADQNIKIDLDDGVVHNYELFADVLAKRK